MNDSRVVLNTDLPLPLFILGKVRDTYNLGNHLLVIATDRISAFDSVLPCGIPNKGLVLNQLSIFWFRQTADLIPNHLVEAVDDMHCLDSYIPAKDRFPCPPYLVGRSMIVKKVKRIPVECVVRGYLAGSAWAEYRQSGTIGGLPAHKGLRESQELPRPLIIADTKMEFGLDDNRLILIDELLTPDSSRLWDASLYKVGRSQPSFDKQPVRDWLVQAGWDKKPPAPELPPEVIEATTKRYEQAYEKLAGRKLVSTLQ